MFYPKQIYKLKIEKMNLQDCTRFANENPMCFLATSDGDQAHVRTVMLMFAEESGFYFETFPNKEMAKQMHQNPKVELCFYNHAQDMMESKQLRIKGNVEFDNDPATIDRVYEKIKVLEPIAGGPFKEMIEVYKLPHGDAHFWTMNDVGKEDSLEHLNF